jgi:3'-5' exoribonuclease
MSRLFVRDLKDGAQVEEIFLVREKQIRTNKAGAAYLQLDLDDRTGSISARYWNATADELKAIDSGDFCRIVGRVQNFQGNLQLIVTRFAKVDPQSVIAADFIPATERNLDELETRLRTRLGRIADPALAAVARAFLLDVDLMERYREAPAGVRQHHAYRGGLLEHVVTMLDAADAIAPVYPGLNADLLAMGVFLHDLGKVRELACERTFRYTDEGQLVGHVLLGVELLNEKLTLAEELLGRPVPADTALALKHLIASHHGTIEFGAARLPMTPEAIALWLIDNLDARLHQAFRALKDDLGPDGRWSNYDPTLERRFFRGGPTASSSAPPSTAP